jgi:foldase protein PrsA
VLKGSKAVVGFAVACVAVALAGCGSSKGGGSGGLPAGVAVQVGTRTISEAAVAHWTPIEAILATEVFPKGPVPKGVVPDPPNYTNCISYEKQLNASHADIEPKPGVAQLKTECQKRYHATRQHILDLLILYQWMLSEAAEKHMNITDQEAIADLKEHEHSQFTSPTAFQNYLAWTGLSMADEILRFKNNLLANKILKNVIGNPRLNAEQRHRAYVGFIQKWVAKTNCNPRYIVPNCKQYKGPLPPGS